MTAPLAPRPEPIPGYKLLERLGRGGFGEVWKCEAPGGIHKAIKFVFGDLEGAAEDGKPAEQEFKALARVKTVRHPFILSIERYEVIDGQLMIVMELADRNLWDRYRECRGQSLPGVPREELLGYMEEVAEALDLMNQEHNLQHLDIKPQNLFLIHKHVKVADFGLVKDFEGMSASVTGGVTPVYAAPETFDNRVTRFCDQYSLAIVYQELLTGHRPFNGSTTRQLILQHMTQPPNLEPLPEDDRAAVGRALSKKPEDRFPSCTAFVHALELSAAITPPAVIDPNRPTVSLAPVAPAPAPAAPKAHPANGARVPLASELISRRDPSITQRVGNAPATMQRPDFAPSVLFDRLPNAPPEQTGDGCLLPAVVLGIGHLGGLVLRRLRRAITEQCGSTTATPHLRLLAVDTDAEATRGLTTNRNTPLEAREVYLAKLHRPSHYLNKGRDAGARVEAWLAPHLLYRLPRQPSTTGLRGLGRLAFWDHFIPLEQRIRTTLEAALDPAALAEADRQTGLGVRTNRPRVYIVANPAGGTGGGFLLDLAYLVRHVLRQLGHFRAEMVGVLLLPPTERAAPQSPVLANTFATLAELDHFSRSDTRYELKISAGQPPLIDETPPFERCLCLPLASTADIANQKQSAGLAATLLARELLTPLGRTADEIRPEDRPADDSGCGSVYTASVYALRWPRRRLARRAGLRLAAGLVRSWTSKDADTLRPAVQAWLDEQWEARQLRPEQVVERLQEGCEALLGQVPDNKFDGVVAPMVERLQLGSPPDAWAVCKALDEVIHLVGKPAESEKAAGPPGPVRQAIGDAGRALATEYEQKLAELAVHFIERPQYRLAAAEEAIRQLTERLRQVLETYDGLQHSLHRESAETLQRIMQVTGTLDSLAPSRRSAMLQEALELLRAYPKKRYQALVAELVASIYRGLLNVAPDYLREVNFCRLRLGEVSAAVEAAVADGADGPAVGPGRELFPGGGATLDEAAARVAQSLAPDEVLELDGRVQQQIRRQFQALVSYCLQSQGQVGPLVELLGQQAEEFVAARLGEGTAAEVFFQHFADDPQAAARTLAQAYDEAEPELAVPPTAARIDVLATPIGPAGNRLRASVHEAVPGAKPQSADSADEVVFYRAACGLRLTDLPQLGPVARDAYQHALDSDRPPHARADVKWQLPPARGSNP